MTKARDIASAAPAPSTVSATELGYLDGVSSAIQTQIDGKQAANANVSTTELGYLDGVTSAIQTQLDGKTAKNTLTTTGDIYYASSANTPARLGIGSSSQVLTVSGGVPTWATPAGGKVLQVVQGTTSTVKTITSTTMTDSNLTASITPTSATSSILAIVSLSFEMYNYDNDMQIGTQLVRGSTTILDASGGSSNASGFLYVSSSTLTQLGGYVNYSYLDSPSTTSSTTYKVQGRVGANGAGTGTVSFNNTLSTIILLEIGA
jgi:hypothetical protein